VVGGQLHAPTALSPLKKPGTHWLKFWVQPESACIVCGKETSLGTTSTELSRLLFQNICVVFIIIVTHFRNIWTDGSLSDEIKVSLSAVMIIFKLSFSLHFTGIFRWGPYFLFEETRGFSVTPFGNDCVSGSMKCSYRKSFNIIVFLPEQGGRGVRGGCSPTGYTQDPTACKYCISHIRCRCPIWHVSVRNVTSSLDHW
jgi:hypothetical protein